MNHIIIYDNGDDWQAMFVNGVLVEQAHHITVEDLSDHCPIGKIERIEMSRPVRDFVRRVGDFDPGITFEAAQALKPGKHD